MTISYTAIKEIVDEWDPVGLLITHAPKDEYDGESKKVFNKLRDLTTVSVEELSRIIYDVFVKSFGDDVFISDLSACKEIAGKILAE